MLCALAACGEVASGAKGEVMLTQTNSAIVATGFACSTATTPRYVSENSFYRSFALADYDVSGAFTVKKVSFGVFVAISGGPGLDQPADLSIYAYDGPVGGETIDLSKLTKQGQTMNILIHNSPSPVTIDIPMTAEIPSGTNAVVVELHVKDGRAAQHQFMIGTNGQGESFPGYQRAPGCTPADPVTIPAAGFPTQALVLSVLGDA
jgi:hypothetical protein